MKGIGTMTESSDLVWRGSTKLAGGGYASYSSKVGDVRLTVTQHLHGEKGVYYGMARSSVLDIADFSHPLGTDAEEAKKKWPHQLVAIIANEEHKLLRVVDGSDQD